MGRGEVGEKGRAVLKKTVAKEARKRKN